MTTQDLFLSDPESLNLVLEDDELYLRDGDDRLLLGMLYSNEDFPCLQYDDKEDEAHHVEVAAKVERAKRLILNSTRLLIAALQARAAIEKTCRERDPKANGYQGIATPEEQVALAMLTEVIDEI